MPVHGAETIADPVPEHPLLAGRREIGRGENSIVIEGDVVNGQAHVFKLLSSLADYAYYTAPDRPTGPHFPVLYADHGLAGRSSRGGPLHLVEVERLYPLPGTGDATDLAGQIARFYLEGCQLWQCLARDMGRLALHHLVVTPRGWADTLRQALQALEQFAVEYDVLPDLLKADNLMVRLDGTLVFSDPVFTG